FVTKVLQAGTVLLSQWTRLTKCFILRFPIIILQVLLASCFVPVYAGFNAVNYKGEKWFDGGFTNALPILPTGRTVTVSPFCGRQNICPNDKEQMEMYFKIANQDMMLSAANFQRLGHALFPPSQEKMESVFQDGFKDAVNFLESENWYE
ncbi:patatin-like phospholipase domain-containing protein 4, partial [Pyxicephalus adspersus]|uniref:patatin-like phospholipase domain-containing protein 4 n=1 Tax=Pyxicephalus adspersus TaxID=30357 RepID=UPI003B59269A